MEWLRFEEGAWEEEEERSEEGSSGGDGEEEEGEKDLVLVKKSSKSWKAVKVFPDTILVRSWKGSSTQVREVTTKLGEKEKEKKMKLDVS